MTVQLILLLAIVLMALIVFIGGWLSVDLVGLLVLSALALLEFLSPEEALAGFSSPAVVTVWAMFILSAGLTRTGIAYRIGQPLQRFSKGSEVVLMVVLMVTASLFSALINTTTVAAILLPTAMDLARRSGRQPARLLMPFSLGCLLGGPFTGISTAPNIIATDILHRAGFEAFKIFDFTPITGAIVVAGILFMVTVGRFLLPAGSQKTSDSSGLPNAAPYGLDAHLVTTRIRPGSPLAGRTLAESRFGSALFVTVVALQRKGVLILAPPPTEILQRGDELIMHGQADIVQQFNGSQHLQIESFDSAQEMIFQQMIIAHCSVSEDSSLLGATLAESELRRLHQVHVLALQDPEGKAIRDARNHRFAAGDRLLLQGEKKGLEALVQKALVTEPQIVTRDEMDLLTHGRAKLLPVRIPPGSVLADRSLLESRLGNVFGLTVVGTQVIPTAALVVLMAPVALSAASSLGISPQLLMMTVAISASASFASPLSHPAHLLVMGPGGYRFMDYVKLGIPLTAIIFAISVWLLPILWPPY